MTMLNNIKQGFLPTSKALYLHSCITVFLKRFSIQRIILGQISTENPIVKKISLFVEYLNSIIHIAAMLHMYVFADCFLQFVYIF